MIQTGWAEFDVQPLCLLDNGPVSFNGSLGNAHMLIIDVLLHSNFVMLNTSLN